MTPEQIQTASWILLAITFIILTIVMVWAHGLIITFGHHVHAPLVWLIPFAFLFFGIRGAVRAERKRRKEITDKV